MVVGNIAKLDKAYIENTEEDHGREVVRYFSRDLWR